MLFDVLLTLLGRPSPKEILVVWWIGINDTGDTINNATITDWSAFWDSEMDSLFAAVASDVWISASKPTEVDPY
jgi:hypothetical protein